MAVKDWSTTAADNDDADATINWLEGQAPSTVNDSSRAMMAAIAAWFALIDQGTVSNGTVGGTASAITLTCSPTVSARVAGQRYLLKLASAITGATTLAVDGLTSGAIQWRGAALVANDFSANDWIVVVDDATNYQLVTPPRVSLVTTAATQAQMEAASDVIAPATAGRLQYHPGVAKCWGDFDFAGTINASHNITSIADTATGRVTVTIATDFSSANWACVIATEVTTGISPSYQSKAAGTIELRSWNSSTQALQDATGIDFVGFGDQ